MKNKNKNKKTSDLNAFLKSTKDEKSVELVVETESEKSFGNMGRWCCCCGGPTFS